MDNKHLQELERRLLHDEAFEATSSYFMEHFGENPEFMNMGTRTSVPMMTNVLGELCKRHFQTDEVKLIGLQVINVPKYKMLHGYVMVNEYLLIFFYCKNISKGLVSMTPMPPTPNSVVHYFRFSSVSDSEGGPVPDNLFDDVFAGRES